MSRTSPTLRPLNRTLEPRPRPVTEPLNSTRTCVRSDAPPSPENHDTKPKPAKITSKLNRPTSA